MFHRALVSAEVASMKKPVSMLRADGKRPDGPFVPWQAEWNAVWNISVKDTVAITYLLSTSFTAGSDAKMAVLHIEGKYREFSVTRFVPIALETIGPESKALLFLRELGHRLTRTTEDLYENAFLFQRLSVAIY